MTTTIKNIGICGAGAMGLGIAQTCAQSGFAVTLYDLDANRLTAQIAKLSKSLDKLVEKSKITAEQKTDCLTNIKTTTTLSDFASCDLVIEAVFEKLEVKLELIKSLNGVLKDSSIFASNTSSISLTKLASAYKNPRNAIGMHFFNPVPVMKLVEVISAVQTAPETADTIVAVAEKLGKSPARVKDMAGFAVNRILVPMINEAIFALQDGVADAATIDLTMKLGANHPMGPLTLADFVGLDVVLDVLEVFQRDLGPERYKPAPLLRKMVEAGQLGVKSGKGFFPYT